MAVLTDRLWAQHIVPCLGSVTLLSGWACRPDGGNSLGFLWSDAPSCRNWDPSKRRKENLKSGVELEEATYRKFSRVLRCSSDSSVSNGQVFDIESTCNELEVVDAGQG